MKIISLNITEFGAIKDRKIELSDSLNIVLGENESGKSTLLLFILYIFYGLQRRSSKNIPSAYDKERSISWSSSTASGSIEIEQEGKRYRIERENIRRTSNSEATITDLSTGERVHIGEEPGEVFLGVSRETFESCLWCGQSRASALNGAKLSDTLSNLSLTADESVNGEAVLLAIKEARKQYKHDKGAGGLIWELSEKISEKSLCAKQKEEQISSTAEQQERLEALEEELIAAKSELDTAEKNLAALAASNVLKRFDAYNRYCEELPREREKLKNYKMDGRTPDNAELATLRQLGALRAQRARELAELRNRGPQISIEETEAAGTADAIEKAGGGEALLKKVRSSLHPTSKKVTGAILCALAAAAAVAATALSFVLMIAIVIIIASAGALMLAAGIVLLALAAKSKRRAARELAAYGFTPDDYAERIKYSFACKKKRDETLASLERARNAAEANLDYASGELSRKLSEYGRRPEPTAQSALDALISDMTSYLNTRNTLERNIYMKERFLERDRSELEGYDEQALRAMVSGGIPANTTESEEKQKRERARGEIARIESEMTDLKIKIKSAAADSDYLADLQRDIELLRAEKSDAEEKFKIYDRAYRAVDEAYTAMRSNFAPKIRESAGELLSGISGGKYSELFISKDFEIGVDCSGREREVGQLSGGTVDAVYIALRMALAKHIFEGEQIPFFMDETLSSLDDTRATAALELVSRFTSEGNQCILLTCHSREANLCDADSIAYKLIEM